MNRVGWLAVAGVAGLILAGCSRSPADVSLQTLESSPPALQAAKEWCAKTTPPAATDLSQECQRVAVATNAMKKYAIGKVGAMKLDQEVHAYMLDNGVPPKSLGDLVDKPPNTPSWNGPYATAADLTDPFGHAYGYRSPGEHGKYDLVFYGRDGKPGGSGIDRDYGNWQL